FISYYIKIFLNLILSFTAGLSYRLLKYLLHSKSLSRSRVKKKNINLFAHF
ncbi:unnamed protein product, partial [Larinioides sclopetarius]